MDSCVARKADELYYASFDPLGREICFLRGRFLAFNAMPGLSCIFSLVFPILSSFRIISCKNICSLWNFNVSNSSKEGRFTGFSCYSHSMHSVYSVNKIRRISSGIGGWCKLLRCILRKLVNYITPGWQNARSLLVTCN